MTNRRDFRNVCSAHSSLTSRFYQKTDDRIYHVMQGAKNLEGFTVTETQIPNTELAFQDVLLSSAPHQHHSSF